MANSAADIALVHRFIVAASFTMIVETIILIYLMHYVYKSKQHKTGYVIFIGMLASFCTIPYVWFFFPNIQHWPRQTALLVSEPFAFVVEAILYRVLLDITWKRAVSISFVCNFISYFGDEMLKSYGLWPRW
jgi:hypothetical protein